MSNLKASIADYPAEVTPSDTVDDPAGPFAALLVTTAGSLKVTPRGGPLASSSITLTVVAGQFICFPVKRVWTGNTAAVIGLCDAIFQPGFK